MAKPKQLLKWNRLAIAREFGMDSRTVGKRLADAELERKDSFSTREVFTAMVGDLGAEKIRETRERADKLSMENAARRGELVEVKAVAEVVNRAIGSMRGYVLGLTRLEEDERDEMLIKLGAIYESAFNIQDGDEADVEPAAPVDGEPVGR
jgi:hypothetical protein